MAPNTYRSNSSDAAGGEESSAQPGPAASATKRKAALEEIEVDVSAPEPPSKRARRALKRGKTLPNKTRSDTDDDGNEDDGDHGTSAKGEKKDKVRSEHGVWIGNLPFTVTAADLRKWLVDNSGEAISDASVTRIKLPTVKERGGRDKDKKPANKGFAYVDFLDVGGKVAAMALSETDLGGRRLLIKDARSFEGRPQKEKEEPEPRDGTGDGPSGAKPGDKQDDSGSRKVFVGNMSFKTTEEDVRSNFEKCGEIEWVKVATFEDTGKCKGYGWIKFREASAAAWAVKGFVKIKERVETEADLAGDGVGEQDGATAQPRVFKTRKWWVNRLLGRELKLELAEDDQVRYKKRFGKDAKQSVVAGPTAAESGARRPGGGRRDREAGGAAEEGRALRGASDINVARLTGAVVKPQGTMVTFD